MTAEERRVLEEIAAYQKFLKESVAEAMVAVVEVSNAAIMVSEAVAGMTQKLGELFDQQRDMNDRINRYIFDQAQQDGKVARLDKLISEVLAIQKAANNG